MSESKQTESETSMSSNILWPWPSRAELPAADVRGPPKPLNVPDAHDPEVGDIYEYSGRHWRVCKLAGVCANFMTIEPGAYMADVPIGYVQRYMRRIWPED